MTMKDSPREGTEIELRLSQFAPAARPPMFAGADVAYVIEDTRIGRMLLARNDSGALLASSFVRDDAAEGRVVERLARVVSPRVLRLPAALDQVRRQLDNFLEGRSRTFSLPVDLALATPFQRLVLTRLAQGVPYGARATYRQLARQIDRPAASRAVGAALGANPLCVVMPCHRVVGSTGNLTGYAGGLAAKEYLLALESGHCQ